MNHRIQWAILRTKKTEEQVRELCQNDSGLPASEEEIRNCVKYYELLDGIKALVSETLSHMPGKYVFLGAAKEYEDRWKEACYLSEQDPFFGVYIDQREEFDAAWEADEYYSEGTLHLEPDEVELIDGERNG